ncbi:MAG: hypothetical protein RBR71_03470 [Gudongella sp.]|nr:hypothetical protein [Gudongella sp.]
MQLDAKIKFKMHNRFDFVITDVETGEVEKAYASIEPHAENTVLNRMYDRLLAYGSYFDNIVFGSGTGPLDQTRNTLFSRISSKAAIQESLTRDGDTSLWVKRIRLETGDNNGTILREVGISDTTVNINTHALIVDSEGNPLEIEKNNQRIIDIYASVFIEIYSVDTGCFFSGNGLRNYLTGGGAPANVIGLFGFNDDGTTINATKTTNSTEKSISVSGTFNVYSFNKDVMAIEWTGMGIRWELPRTGVYTGTSKTDVKLGLGDGIKDTFQLPNQQVTNLTVFIEGVATTAYTRNISDEIVFDTPVPIGLIPTANYTTKFIPKNGDYELDVTMKMSFGVNQPTPVIPVPDHSELPGAKTLVAGNIMGGYFGEVAAVDFISGDALCAAIGLTAGTLQNSTAGWLKCNSNGKVLYVGKKTFKHTVSWDNINAAGAVFGEKKVQIGNHVFAVRLLSSNEWNKLIYPVHKDYGQWAQYDNVELNITGNGGYCWTSTPSGSNRILRGNSSVSVSGSSSPSGAYSNYGFRPVLEFLYTLPSSL